jgi:cytochrome c-type biogenesis protein CcmE
MKKKKSKFIIGGLLIVAAVLYLIYSGVQETMVYYLTPSELLSKGEQVYDKGVRVSGRIEDGSIESDVQKMDLSFRITDGKQTIPVTYHGIVPDTFKYGVDVIIEGKFKADQTFQATKLMAKCPSKYEPEA